MTTHTQAINSTHNLNNHRNKSKHVYTAITKKQMVSAPSLSFPLTKREWLDFLSSWRCQASSINSTPHRALVLTKRCSAIKTARHKTAATLGQKHRSGLHFLRDAATNFTCNRLGADHDHHYEERDVDSTSRKSDQGKERIHEGKGKDPGPSRRTPYTYL